MGAYRMLGIQTNDAIVLFLIRSVFSIIDESIFSLCYDHISDALPLWRLNDIRCTHSPAYEYIQLLDSSHLRE